MNYHLSYQPIFKIHYHLLLLSYISYHIFGMLSFDISFTIMKWCLIENLIMLIVNDKVVFEEYRNRRM